MGECPKFGAEIFKRIYIYSFINTFVSRGFGRPQSYHLEHRFWLSEAVGEHGVVLTEFGQIPEYLRDSFHTQRSLTPVTGLFPWHLGSFSRHPRGGAVIRVTHLLVKRGRSGPLPASGALALGCRALMMHTAASGGASSLVHLRHEWSDREY